MQYRTLDRICINVSPCALDADINFLDTADAYGDSEEVIGKARGLTDAMIEAVAAGKRPEFETGQEAPAYDFTWQLTHHHAVDGATDTRAARKFGQAGVVEMVGLTGLYLKACAMVNGFNVPVPAGIEHESSAS